jgi:hypothetical protein
MLPLILFYRKFYVHKMQGTTLCAAVYSQVISRGIETIRIWSGQAYLVLSRVKSLNGLRLKEPDCRKQTNQTTSNTDALKKKGILQILVKSNENLKK